MKKTSQLLLVALSMALVACGTLGGGSMADDPNFKKLKAANVSFWNARYHAALCVGNNDAANKAKENAAASQNANNPSDIVVDKSADEAKKLFENKSQVAADVAKKEFKTSVKHFFKGFVSETKLVAVISEKVKEMQAKLQSASPMEKLSITKQLNPMLDILNILKADLANAGGTLDAYTVYATENGIDMAELRKEAEAEAQKEQEGLEG